MRARQVVLPQGLINGKLTLVLLQLRSPFYREAAVIRGMEEPIIGWIEPQHEERRKRLNTLLTSLQRFKKHINMLVFPEYAVSNEMLNQLEAFSLNNNTLVVGTFYDVQTRTNRVFAMFPRNNAPEMITAYKCQRSRFEVDVLRELPDESKELLMLTWHAEGEQFSLLILACLDFLQWPDLPWEIKDSDILVSPMASPTMESFQNTAQNAIRWVRPGQKRTRSRACILCNTVDLSGGGLRTCGESRVIGVTQYTLPPLRSGIEAGMVLDLDCQRLITVPTEIGGQDRAPIEAGSAFLLDEEWRLHWQQFQEVRAAPPEINPNAAGRVGLHKYYSFAQVKRYWKHSQQLRSIPIGCSGIYGVYDIILHSYEESLELMKLRLQAHSPAVVWRELELDDQNCFRVTGTLKYRGIMFAAQKEGPHSYYEIDDLKGLEQDEVDNCLRRIHEWARRGEIEESVRRELTDKCILLDGVEFSDITTEHIGDKKNEYLIFVWLLPDSGKKSPKRVFEESVIYAELANDERVRTIEICEPATPVPSSLLQAHYILHIVGHPMDLADIVLDKIHKTLGNYDIECGTRVVPVAEVLSRDPRESLSESRISDRVTRDRICEIIIEVIGERTPFIIKGLNPQITSQLSRIWLSESSWEERRQQEGDEMVSINDTRHQLARCLHAICFSLTQAEDVFKEETLARLWDYCGGFFREFAGEIEGLLAELIKGKQKKVGSPFVEQLREVWSKYAKRGEGFSGLDRMTLGHLIQSIIYWNQMYEEDRIGNLGLGKNLALLQGHGLAEFRDCFSHTRTGIDAAIRKHIGSKKDAKRLLGAIEHGFKFVLDMKYPSG